jgi:predicted nucleic acid-binding protein
MLKPVFVDTSAFIAMGNRRDFFHVAAIKAKEKLKQENRNLITTEAIFLEFGNAFSAVALKPSAIKMMEAIRLSKKWTVIGIDEKIMNQSFNLYKQMSDKDWGLVDCTSIIVAKNLGISEIFTTDHHFEQAGFQILLK